MEKNIYKCPTFWTWMQQHRFAQNGHMLVENLNRRPDGFIVPTYRMLIGYMIDFYIEHNIPMPAISKQHVKDFYVLLADGIIEFEEAQHRALLDIAIQIGLYKVVNKPQISKGDRVLIKSLRWYEAGCERRGSRHTDFECNGNAFSQSMSSYCEQVVTVDGCSEQCFNIKEDNARHLWNTGMIEGVVIE